MDGVDLSRFRFDYDLTFSVMTMHPDGTVYHRYGGRPSDSADGWLSMSSLVTTLERSLESDRAYRQNPAAPTLPPRRTIRDVEPYNREKLAKKKQACVHCHMVNTALRVEQRAAGTWAREQVWIWPDPDRTGLTLDAEDQRVIARVEEKSPAAAAGLAVGDQLVRLDRQRIATITDVQFVLEQVPWTGGTIAYEAKRGSKTVTGTMKLATGWRAGNPRTFAWRPYKWGLQPAPGFGGPDLAPAAIEALGLAKGSHAFKISYLVTWGVNANLGRNAARAGIREGDVVVEAAGESFDSCQHFHAWFRLTRSLGERVPLVVIRNGEHRTITLEVVPSRAF